MIRSQRAVADYYEEKKSVYNTGTVGNYVRVVLDRSAGKEVSCFGPVEELDGTIGWTVVEINWEDRSFLLAPSTEVYEARTDD